MKGAIILILILLMWFITAQSIEASWYELTTYDNIFLQNVFASIDKKVDTQDKIIEKRIASYLDYFPSNSRQYKLLHEIYAYIHQEDPQIDSPENIYTKDMIELLGEQF